MNNTNDFYTVIDNPCRYSGMFVATKSFEDNDIITSGENFTDVLQEAINFGFKNPVVFYVADKNEINIY